MKLKKIMFNEVQFLGDYGDGNGMVKITKTECRRFINSLGTKCFGSLNGFTVYAYK